MILKVIVLKFDTIGLCGTFLGVSDAFCWLSNISIFDAVLDFDASNIDVMKETCHLQGINEINTLDFLGGGGDESPCWGALT